MLQEAEQFLGQIEIDFKESFRFSGEDKKMLYHNVAFNIIEIKGR